jgi:hypothetical protein
VSLMPLLPPELIDLPSPWSITHDFRRADAVEKLALEPSHFSTSLDVLERTLRALPHLEDPATLPLPEQIGDAYGFAIHQIAEQITTFDGLTERPFVEYLEDLTEHAPEAGTVTALAKAWVHSVCSGMIRSSLRWLGSHWQQFPSEQRGRLVSIASTAWPKLPEDLAITLLTTVSTVARQDSLELLSLVEAQATTPAVRDLAKRYRAWTATRDTPGR